MSDNSDKAAWKITTDREQIEEWAEDHETVPLLAEKTGRGDLRLLSDPDDDLGEELSWDQFFERFEAESLALRYRETETAGADQPAYELVARDEITGEDGDGGEAPDSFEADVHEDDDDSRSTPPEGAGATQADSETAEQSDPLTSDADANDAAE